MGSTANDRARIRTSAWNGWELRVSGPADARHIAVLLPGGLSNATFFDLMPIDERLDERSVRLVAATPPGFGGLPAPKQLDFEWYVPIRRPTRSTQKRVGGSGVSRGLLRAQEMHSLNGLHHNPSNYASPQSKPASAP